MYPYEPLNTKHYKNNTNQCTSYIVCVLSVGHIILENKKNFYKNSEDVGMAQKAQKQERDVTQ